MSQPCISGQTWLIAAAAILDAASFCISALDAKGLPSAGLCHTTGVRALRLIAAELADRRVASVCTANGPLLLNRAAFDVACDRLAALGSPIKGDRDECWRRFTELRREYEVFLPGLATSLLVPMDNVPTLLPTIRKHASGDDGKITQTAGSNMTDISRSLNPVDSLIVDVLTDDVSDPTSARRCSRSRSSPTSSAPGPSDFGRGAAMRQSRFWIAVGVTGRRGEAYLLFDTGTEGPIFFATARISGIALGRDRMHRGQPRPLGPHGRAAGGPDAIGEQGGKGTVHVNPGCSTSAVFGSTSGTIIPVAKVPLTAELDGAGATVVNDPAARLLLDGHFYYSGEIPRLSAFEKGRIDHLCRTAPTPRGNPTRS